MDYLELDLPVPLHPTLNVLDSSKLQTLQDCPRKFFYQYVLGWRADEPNIHLVFGSAWHEAMEVFMLAMKEGRRVGYTPQVVELAHSLFDDYYTEGMGALGLSMNTYGKDSGNALSALRSYARKYKYDDFDTLHTEIACVVPISETRVIHGKLDSIIRDSKGIWSMEHKTAGRMMQAWTDKWSMMLQVGTYAHVLYNVFGDEAVGVKINGSIIRKETKAGASNDFIRVPVRKSRSMMNDWLFTVNHWVGQLDWNMEALAECKESDEVMTAFPKNGLSCTKFGCPFSGLCGAVANPLRMAHTPPPGFVVDHWDPRREDDKAKYFVDFRTGSEVLPAASPK